MRWAGHVARVGKERKLYKVSVGKAEGNRPLGRPRRKCEDGIRMNLREIYWGGGRLNSTGSVWGPVASCYECGDEPAGSCATELVTRFQMWLIFRSYLSIVYHAVFIYSLARMVFLKDNANS
jgi:hypothetical protein